MKHKIRINIDMHRQLFFALTLLFILLVPVATYAGSSPQEQFTQFKNIPWLYYSYANDELVLKVDYSESWGYKLMTFKFPDRLALDISFKDGAPEDFNPEAGFPVWEIIELPAHFVLTGLAASVDEEGMRVDVSSRFPLEYEPFFDEENNQLIIRISLVYRQEEKKEISDGLEYRLVEMADKSGPRRFHILYIDTTAGRYFPGILMAKDYNRKLLSAKEMVNKSGSVCAVNGGFFSSDGNSQGLLIRNKQLISYPKFERPVFARTTDGKIHIGYLPFHGVVHGPNGISFSFDAVDSTPGSRDVVLLTPGHPSRLSANLKGSKIVIRDNVVEQVTTDEVTEKKWRYILWSPSPRDDFKDLKVGDTVELEFGLGIADIEIESAIGGGPMLVSNGKVEVGRQDEFKNDIMLGRAPRTGVGMTKDGLLIFAVLEGRNPLNSIGGTLTEFAELLREYGAYSAMNLDGGASCAMIVKNEQVVQSLAGTRGISNALGIFDMMETGVF
jgi:hypothetical protein